MKIFNIFSQGAEIIVDAYLDPRDYVLPSGQEFSSDRSRLNGDVKKVGNDMRRVIEKKHVERSNQGSRNR
jgi:hypothetical protein